MGNEIDSGEFARLRQGLYRFSGAALLHPDCCRVEALVDASAVLRDEPLDAFSFYSAWNALFAYLDGTPDAIDIEAEFVRLFSPGLDTEQFSPRESRYVAPAGIDAGRVVTELAREYAELGIGVASGRAELPDHASVELEVMAFLCHKEATAWQGERPDEAVEIVEEQRSFLSRHLAIWFGAFSSDVGRLAPGGFYDTVTEATNALIQHDEDFMSAIVRDLEEVSHGAD